MHTTTVLYVRQSLKVICYANARDARIYSSHVQSQGVVDFCSNSSSLAITFFNGSNAPLLTTVMPSFSLVPSSLLLVIFLAASMALFKSRGPDASR